MSYDPALRQTMLLRLLRTFAAALACCFAAMQPAQSRPQSDDRPNILFILTDDQAPWAVGGEDATFTAHAERHPDLKTPHLNRLAQEGALFSNAFVVTPVCSPSRAELLTSRYGSELGITDWIHPQREVSHGLDPAVFTWVDLLNQAGYATGLVGKWHLGTQDRFHPTKMGYDTFFGFRSGGNTPRDPVLEKNGVTRRYDGFTQDILTDGALDFLRAHQDEPFLLSLHYRAPHRAWLPLPEEDWRPYENLDVRIPNPDYPLLDVDRVTQSMREYLGAVASIDRNLGRLLSALDELGLEEKTIVVFTSDHGYNVGHNGIWHKGNGHWILTDPPPGSGNVPEGQRPNMYDHSLKVPLLVRWPGTIEAGTTVDEVVSNLDWYPTLAQMGGARIPAGQTVRGRSFLPLLRGETQADWPTDVYAEYSTHHQSWTHMRAYRTPAWKLVRDLLNPDRDELYHLASDPAEATNLVDRDTPDVRRVLDRLDARILERMAQIGDPALPLADRLLP